VAADLDVTSSRFGTSNGHETQVSCSRCGEEIHDTRSILRELCEECQLHEIDAALDGTASMTSDEIISRMGWEETERELKLATDRRKDLEEYAVHCVHQSGTTHCAWLDLKDLIASLAFRLNWELQRDRFAIERFQ